MRPVHLSLPPHQPINISLSRRCKTAPKCDSTKRSEMNYTINCTLDQQASQQRSPIRNSVKRTLEQTVIMKGGTEHRQTSLIKWQQLVNCKQRTWCENGTISGVHAVKGFIFMHAYAYWFRHLSELYQNRSAHAS